MDGPGLRPGGRELKRPAGSPLRPALEAAISVARAGELEQPPIPSPTKLLPYLQFSKYPPAALDVARRVLDEDEAFRSRVLEQVDLEQLGKAAELFLARPPGWGSALAKLEASASAHSKSQAADRQERRATKQLQITKEALEQARSHADEEATEAGKLRDALEVANDRTVVLETRVAELERRREQAGIERANAVRELKAMESRLAERTQEVRRLTEQVAELGDQVVKLRLELDRRTPIVPMVEGPVEPVEPPIDRGALSAAVVDATRAASALALALEQAAGVLDLDLEPEADAPGSAATGRRSAGRTARRRPVRLPVGMFDDSVEAAAALTSVANMLLLVDGYNVTLSGWPDLPLTFQRERLIDALAGIEAKTGTAVLVIFDGSEAGRDLPPESRARGVQVRFTEPGVEADDVIIESVGLVPVDRPVTVVSSDNRVREGARRGGANLLYSHQLLGLVRS